MRYPVLFFVVSAGMVMASVAPSDKDFTPLFNGKDLSAWEQVGPGGFTVEDGALKTEGGMGLLWYTREKIGNAILRVVYRQTSVGANSGVFIRLPEPPMDAWHAVHTGYEVQILEQSDSPSFDDYHRTGALYSIAKAGTYPPSADGWNTMEITLDGPRTIVHVNGTKVTDFHDSDPVPPRRFRYEPERGARPDAGYIGLQNHNAESIVYFKEVSVKPLSK